MNTLAIIFGILALILWIGSVQVKERHNILLVQALANFFYALQYYFLGFLSTALMNLVSTIRCITFARSAKLKKQPHEIYLITFLILILLIAIRYCNTFLDFLPIVATMLYTISAWLNKDSILRYVYILCACIFSIYNYKMGAYIPLIGNFGEIISGTISLVRFKSKRTIKQTV